MISAQELLATLVNSNDIYCFVVVFIIIFYLPCKREAKGLQVWAQDWNVGRQWYWTPYAH